MTQTTESNDARAWARPNVNLRLSKRRREQLRALLSQSPESATPTDVIDHALKVALGSDRDFETRLMDMEDAAEQRDMQQRFEFDRLQASIAELAKRVGALHALISTVAQGDEV